MGFPFKPFDQLMAVMPKQRYVEVERWGLYFFVFNRGKVEFLLVSFNMIDGLNICFSQNFVFQ